MTEAELYTGLGLARRGELLTEEVAEIVDGEIGVPRVAARCFPVPVECVLRDGAFPESHAGERSPPRP